ncbi:MAG: DUF2268 domain-containing putative Zn-dependent protease [Nitrospira sp.]
MKKIIYACLLSATTSVLLAPTTVPAEINKEYQAVLVDKSHNPDYNYKLEKGVLYAINVLQQGIDVKLILTDKNEKQILDKDTPNGAYGYEKFEYTPPASGIYHLKIVRLEEEGNSEKGEVNILVKKISKSEIALREKIKKELAPENAKVVQTLDIDHFWEAFDNLKNCKTRKDSIASFQALYLDRATDGLKDFIDAREFTAEKFVNEVAHLPKFYNSIRKNTWESKNAVPLVEDVVSKFREIYPNFKPFKVCFAIGLVNTGGTVSDKFLLIGTEVSTSTANTDLSEFNNSAYSKQLANGSDVVQKIKNIIAHEYVHTQQTTPLNKDAVSCSLLYMAMQEGFCDFIGELTSGSQINLVGLKYGDAHENELWQNFKNELCNSNANGWLYNYSSVKDKPADLGYYIGYKIAQEYYKNATDKKQAVIDIIEMNDPLGFLQRSRYDKKEKK